MGSLSVAKKRMAKKSRLSDFKIAET